ncbi:NUDIX hydrolase [uncultured Azohydromonas sp.]|jgi:NTP pyrophosphohydrolases including oxidative damage repair enzymes|uniref:NUDIX domain-containing protein n=1 Tax=uncultured Azohydromonas sp. TaxID=487342 RepID=UPI0026164C57|nr:NUDIX hydrolase [uncultured Azohydromonas sp.]
MNESIPHGETPEIVCTGSRVVYQNRWIKVREDAIVRADGTPGIYSVVERADFAAIVAIEAGQIYLVEQFRYPVGGRHWELPQGAWEDDPGKSPEEVARGELREETGLVAGKMHHAGSMFIAYGLCTQRCNVFLATELTHQGQQLDAEEAGLICRPFPLPEFENMLRDGVIQDGVTMAVFGLLRLKGLV